MMQIQSSTSPLDSGQHSTVIDYKSIEKLSEHNSDFDEKNEFLRSTKVVFRTRTEHHGPYHYPLPVQSVASDHLAGRENKSDGRSNTCPQSIDTSLDPCSSSLSSDRESPSSLKNHHSSLSCLTGLECRPEDGESCNVSPSTTTSATTISGPIGNGPIPHPGYKSRSASKSKNNAFKR